MNTDGYYLQFFGVILIILGVLLLIVPTILEKVPALEQIPWLLIYVYRSDGFVFVTSPILIVLSILSILWYLVSSKSN